MIFNLNLYFFLICKLKFIIFIYNRSNQIKLNLIHIFFKTIKLINIILRKEKNSVFFSFISPL
jgi:hypothetical protein